MEKKADQASEATTPAHEERMPRWALKLMEEREHDKAQVREATERVREVEKRLDRVDQLNVATTAKLQQVEGQLQRVEGQLALVVGDSAPVALHAFLTYVVDRCRVAAKNSTAKRARGAQEPAPATNTSGHHLITSVVQELRTSTLGRNGGLERFRQRVKNAKAAAVLRDPSVVVRATTDAVLDGRDDVAHPNRQLHLLLERLLLLEQSAAEERERQEWLRRTKFVLALAGEDDASAAIAKVLERGRVRPTEDQMAQYAELYNSDADSGDIDKIEMDMDIVPESAWPSLS